MLQRYTPATMVCSRHTALLLLAAAAFATALACSTGSRSPAPAAPGAEGATTMDGMSAETSPPRDGGAGDAATPDATPDANAAPDAALSGCGTGGRYMVIEASAVGCGPTGTGRVLDRTTGLTWKAREYQSASPQNQAHADSYCSSEGMRLPTVDEALGISGASWQGCAFPCGWHTWTSSTAAVGYAWLVDSYGNRYVSAVGSGYYGVLCVE